MMMKQEYLAFTKFSAPGPKFETYNQIMEHVKNNPHMAWIDSRYIICYRNNELLIINNHK